MTVASIAIHGAAGRMGRRLVALAASDPDLRVVAAVDSPTHPAIGQDAGILAGGPALGVLLVDSLGNVTPDVVIDFSVPVASEMVAAVCVKRKIPLVMATTGLSDEQRQQL